MSLSASNTAEDIVTALEGLGHSFGSNRSAAVTHWNAIINALYVRIKADIEIHSVVATGIHVSVTGTATAQTGATDATGTALNDSVT